MQSGANAQGKDIRTPIANVFAVKKGSRLWWFHRRLSSDQCVTRKRKDIRTLIANVFPSDLFTRTLLHWIYAAEFLYRRAGCDTTLYKKTKRILGLRFCDNAVHFGRSDCLPHRASRSCFSLELWGENSASPKALHEDHSFRDGLCQ